MNFLLIEHLFYTILHFVLRYKVISSDLNIAVFPEAEALSVLKIPYDYIKMITMNV